MKKLPVFKTIIDAIGIVFKNMHRTIAVTIISIIPLILAGAIIYGMFQLSPALGILFGIILLPLTIIFNNLYFFKYIINVLRGHRQSGGAIASFMQMVKNPSILLWKYPLVLFVIMVIYRVLFGELVEIGISLFRESLVLGMLLILFSITIVQGILFASGILYAPLSVVDKANGPLKAIAHVWRIFKGSRWRSFFASLLSIIIFLVLLVVIGILPVYMTGGITHGYYYGWRVSDGAWTAIVVSSFLMIFFVIPSIAFMITNIYVQLTRFKEGGSQELSDENENNLDLQELLQQGKEKLRDSKEFIIKKSEEFKLKEKLIQLSDFILKYKKGIYLTSAISGLLFFIDHFIHFADNGTSQLLMFILFFGTSVIGLEYSVYSLFIGVILSIFLSLFFVGNSFISIVLISISLLLMAFGLWKVGSKIQFAKIVLVTMGALVVTKIFNAEIMTSIFYPLLLAALATLSLVAYNHKYEAYIYNPQQLLKLLKKHKTSAGIALLVITIVIAVYSGYLLYKKVYPTLKPAEITLEKNISQEKINKYKAKAEAKITETGNQDIVMIVDRDLVYTYENQLHILEGSDCGCNFENPSQNKCEEEVAYSESYDLGENIAINKYGAICAGSEPGGGGLVLEKNNENTVYIDIQSCIAKNELKNITRNLSPQDAFMAELEGKEISRLFKLKNIDTSSGLVTYEIFKLQKEDEYITLDYAEMGDFYYMSDYPHNLTPFSPKKDFEKYATKTDEKTINCSPEIYIEEAYYDF